MYWVSFALLSLFEAWTWYIVSWVPFYAYFRLLVLSYLVLPQTQGARILYQSYIHPFLAQHEARIENFITDAHGKAKSAGLGYIEQLVDYVKVNVLGMQSKPVQQYQAPGVSYAQALLSRFDLPSARQGLAAPAGDFYGLISAAMGTMARGATSRDAQIDELSKTGTLIPQNITGVAGKINFLYTQREKLQVLLSALDKEAKDLEIQRDVERRVGAGGHSPSGGLQKSKSEAEFDNIDKSEASGQTQQRAASWMPWSWGAKADTGTSSGVEMR
jgi:receptor expression-enhancing protein 1/2/3/4